jgi:hypothetical protein
MSMTLGSRNGRFEQAARAPAVDGSELCLWKIVLQGKGPCPDMKNLAEGKIDCHVRTVYQKNHDVSMIGSGIVMCGTMRGV